MDQTKKIPIVGGIIFFLIIVGVIINYLILDRIYNKTSSETLNPTYNSISQANMGSRNMIIKLVRKIAQNNFEKKPISNEEIDKLKISGDWEVQIKIYHQGKIKGEGKAKDKILSSALKQAVINAIEKDSLDKESLNQARFLVTLSSSNTPEYSFIEHNGQGKELVKDLVAIRTIDKGLIEQKIKQGKEYLLRVINKEKGGVPKYYWPFTDSFEKELRTTYTSTLLYSLLKIYNNFEKDERILESIPKITNFIFFMQNKDKKSKTYGAFHYSFNTETKQRDNKFVAGTNSKTIFTLLELYDMTHQQKYLEGAELAADFLLTMQKDDGKMDSFIRYDQKEKKWYRSPKFSFFYNGQSLSAFSRIYKTTGKEKYYKAAEKIAENFILQVENKGCYLGDDYRSENPISSSWVIMSLLDFYKASHKEKYKEIVFKCSDELLLRQMQDENDLFHYGRWENSYSTSGNGWINEVLGEVYNFCKEEKRNDCQKYKEAILKASRWIIERTYSQENSYFLDNPKAIGGIFWSAKEKYIRTDSVAHALNGYLNIFPDLKEGVLLSIPEKNLILPISLK